MKLTRVIKGIVKWTVRLLVLALVVGFVLVAFLFITGLSNDIGRLRGEGFGVR